MVQFLSIIFFSWISSIFVGFFKSSRFFVSPYTSDSKNITRCPTPVPTAPATPNQYIPKCNITLHKWECISEFKNIRSLWRLSTILLPKARTVHYPRESSCMVFGVGIVYFRVSRRAVTFEGERYQLSDPTNLHVPLSFSLPPRNRLEMHSSGSLHSE